MIYIKIIVFILITIGLFIKLHITPKAYITSLIDFIKVKVFNNTKKSLRERIIESKKIHKETYFEKVINETKEIMINTGTIDKFNKIIIISIVLGFIGIIISLLLNNIYLLPIITFIMIMSPFYYIKIQNSIYRSQMKKELETALANITSSYIRSDTTFLEAIKENIPNIKRPLRDTFESFVFKTEHINSNIRENLLNLKKTINDDTYKEWIDGIIASINDNNLKAMLPSIIAKYTDMRIINYELKTKAYAPLKDYIIMVLLTISSVPIMFVFNRDWGKEYINMTLGKIEIAIVSIIILISSVMVIKILKPAEYRS